MPGRDIAGCLRVVQALQSHGLSWMSSVSSRLAVKQAMHYYMTRVGIAVDSLPPIIHIAGTKGKGSTAAFTESILRNAGLRTGLFTSPHLVSVCERFKLDGKSVGTDTFLRHFWTIWDILNSSTPAIAPPELIAEFRQSSGIGAAATHLGGATPVPDAIARLPALPGFNFLTLLGFQLFCEAKVDVVVLEVGLGGRLDATNVVETPAVCGITTLDFDHVELLGHTLSEIAGEKAGIFKAGVPAVTSPQRLDALTRLAEAAAEEGAPLYLVDPSLLAGRNGGTFPQLSLSGSFQRTNASTAVALCDVFMHQLRLGRLGGHHLSTEQVDHIYSTYNPGGPADALRMRRSSFMDSFSSTSTVTVGVPQVPPPTYDPSTPLSPSTLHALASTSWPGRSQVIEIDPETCKAVSHMSDPCISIPPRIRLFVDGAHTQSSMAAACSWFVHHSRPSPTRRRKCILVFNCGIDKDTLQLLLPLSTMHFDKVFFTTVPWLLTPRTSSLTADQALAAFLERKSKMEDTEAVKDIQEGLKQAGKTIGHPATATTHEATSGKLAWQRTLQSLHTSLVCEPEYRLIRERLRQQIGVQDELPVTQDTYSIQPSISEILTEVCSEFKREVEPMDYFVFVTGSLYLVGHTLEVTAFPME
jgi:folylpolyglutamate synthase/dihydrofolate synthase